MQIRPLAPADHSEWLRMRQRLWPTTAGSHFTSHSAVTGETEREAVFVAEDEGQLVGFVEVSLRSHAEGCRTDPVGFLEGWYVEPEIRASGVGRGLVRAAENWARERGCTEMASDCGLENTVGLVAHEHLGYRPTVRSVFLRKPLSP